MRTARMRPVRFISTASPAQQTAIRCWQTSKMMKSTTLPQMPLTQSWKKHVQTRNPTHLSAKQGIYQKQYLQKTSTENRMYVVFTPPPSGLLFYFVVLPKPPFLTASASSSTVIPYSTKIPCMNPVPAGIWMVLSSLVSLVSLAKIWPSLSEKK